MFVRYGKLVHSCRFYHNIAVIGALNFIPPHISQCATNHVCLLYITDDPPSQLKNEAKNELEHEQLINEQTSPPTSGKYT